MRLDQTVQVGLIIDEPWISKILDGEKTWEMRSTRTSKLERIALIRKGSGLVVGLATIVECRGPLNDAQLSESIDKHRVPVSRIGKWRYAWVLQDVQRLEKPIPYRHRAGAVKFVRFDPDVVAALSSVA